MQTGRSRIRPAGGSALSPPPADLSLELQFPVSASAERPAGPRTWGPEVSVPCLCSSPGQDVLSISVFKPHFQEVLLIAPNTLG